MSDAKQQLLDQKRQIVKKKWFTDLQINEIRKKSRIVIGDSVASDISNSVDVVRLGEDGIDVYLNESYVVLEDACVDKQISKIMKNVKCPKY